MIADHLHQRAGVWGGCSGSTAVVARAQVFPLAKIADRGTNE